MRLFHHSSTVATATYSGEPTHFVHLKITKRGRFACRNAKFNFSAGQTAFVKIPSISKVEWHPFSIASAPSDEHVEFLIDAGKYGKNSWTGKLWHQLADKTLKSNFEAELMGPCGSSFQTSSNYHGMVLVGGGSGLTSSLSVLRDIVHRHRSTGGTAKPHKVWLVWVTRHVDGMLWCWDGLKRALEGEGTREQKERNVAALDAWLDVSIHVTGCARSEKERAALDRLVASEQGSAASGLGGSWLVHGDRIHRSRIKSWRAKFLSIHASTPKGVKVCFCGPTPMAHDIHAAAGTIKGFSVEVSSENFNEGKRPTAAPPKSDFKVVAREGSRERGLTSVFDDFEVVTVPDPTGINNPMFTLGNPAERKASGAGQRQQQRGSVAML